MSKIGAIYNFWNDNLQRYRSLLLHYLDLETSSFAVSSHKYDPIILYPVCKTVLKVEHVRVIISVIH